ncbi:MAG: hypothetical protein ACTHMM_02930 [Agriterribacter sp.]
MGDKELAQIRKELKKYNEKVANSKTEAKKLLTELGYFNKKGELKKEYKDLCIPQDQD